LLFVFLLNNRLPRFPILPANPILKAILADRFPLLSVNQLGMTSIAQAANPDHVKQLLQTKSCPGCDLSEANLSDKDLQGANLSGADLHSANLSRSNLTQADLSDAKMHHANLTKANLTDADLTATSLYECKLNGIKLIRRMRI
jgi:uncharacterized protein YjbI with pentapeptide repeats